MAEVKPDVVYIQIPKDVIKTIVDAYTTIEASKVQPLPTRDRKEDFNLFKRVFAAYVNKQYDESNVLHFFAGFFGIIPTEEDVTIAKKEKGSID